MSPASALTRRRIEEEPTVFFSRPLFFKENATSRRGPTQVEPLRRHGQAQRQGVAVRLRVLCGEQVLQGQWRQVPWKKDRSRGTARWKDEQWIDVEEFARHGRRVACGAPGKAGKACRPSKRVSPKTPMTVQEAIKRHGRSKVVRLARKKSRDMNMRLNWKRG